MFIAEWEEFLGGQGYWVLYRGIIFLFLLIIIPCPISKNSLFLIDSTSNPPNNNHSKLWNISHHPYLSHLSDDRMFDITITNDSTKVEKCIPVVLGIISSVVLSSKVDIVSDTSYSRLLRYPQVKYTNLKLSIPTRELPMWEFAKIANITRRNNLASPSPKTTRIIGPFR